MKEKNTKAKTPKKSNRTDNKDFYCTACRCDSWYCIFCYLVPDSSFKKDVIIEGILYVIGQGFIRLMKMLGCTTGILLSGLRKYGDRGYQETRNRRCENPGFLSCNNCTGSLRCTWLRKPD